MRLPSLDDVQNCVAPGTLDRRTGAKYAGSLGDASAAARNRCNTSVHGVTLVSCRQPTGATPSPRRTILPALWTWPRNTWPDLADKPGALLRRLILLGRNTLAHDRVAADDAREQAIDATAGALAGAFGPEYLHEPAKTGQRDPSGRECAHRALRAGRRASCRRDGTDPGRT